MCRTSEAEGIISDADEKEEDEEEEPTSEKMIVDNYFMFDGELYDEFLV